MKLPVDISSRLAADFPKQQVATVQKQLAGYSNREPHRVLRCIIYLAEGNRQKLTHFLEAAAADYRDVIFWAEYDKAGKKVRDFNLPFDP